VRSRERTFLSLACAVVVSGLAVANCTCLRNRGARAVRQTQDTRASALASVSAHSTHKPWGCWVPELRALTPFGGRFVSSEAGKAEVVVAAEASPEVRAAAELLARQLSRITERAYTVHVAARSESDSGVWLGTSSELPEFKSDFPEQEPGAAEAYLIRSRPNRLALIAASKAGIEHVVWDFLHQLGYRHYFPGATWEVVPRIDALQVQTDRVCRPAWWQRRLWFSYGTWPDNASEFEQWARENRLGGLYIETGHSYGKIINANRAEFAAHPEYTAGGDVSGSAKFCVRAPGLVELVKRWAAQRFEREPTATSISLEPSDGGGWEGCPDDAALGSPSNRAIALANSVAESINQAGATPRFVGMYAYNEHAAPATIPVDPNVAVFVANAYLPAGLDVQSALRGWRAAGSRPGGTLLGVREYYSVTSWDRDRPGVSRASSPDSLTQALRSYHALGARLFTAESGDGWGAQGLGYWTAAANLWTSDDPAPAAQYVEDFLRGAFGDAAGVMREFYRRIDGSSKPLLCVEQIGELYRLLKRARDVDAAPAVQRRLDALTLYVRYLDLWLEYEFSDASQQRSKVDALLRYTFRIRREHMVHAYGLRRDLASADRTHSLPEATSREPRDDPWRDERPIPAQALRSWRDDGARRPRLPDPPRAQGPLVRLLPPETPSAIATHYLSLRGNQQFQLLFERPGKLELGLQAGTVRQQGHDVELKLCSIDDRTQSCRLQSLPADRTQHAVSFVIERPGHYALDIVDWRQGTVLSWPAGTAITMRATRDERPALSSRWSLCLFVPTGTRTLELYSDGGPGTLRDGSGQIVHRFEARPGIVRVPVRAGQDGRFWQFDSNKGYRLPLNVPPFLAAAPNELLVPAELARQVAATKASAQ
jgi:hypothetical protein